MFLRANPFSESLIRAPATTLAEVRNRATIYIETEEAMQRREKRRKKGGDLREKRETEREKKKRSGQLIISQTGTLAPTVGHGKI